MKFFPVLILSALTACADVTLNYVHDPSLDVIGAQAAGINWGVNHGKTNTDSLTISNVDWYGRSSVSNIYSQGSGNATNATNQANIFIGNYRTNFNFTFGSATNITTNSGVLAYGNNSGTINLGTFNGHAFAMDLSVAGCLSGFTTFFSTIRWVIICVVYLIVFVWAFQALQETIDKTMGQRQMAGSTVSAFGFSASSAVALIFLSICSLAIFSAFAAVVANGFLSSSFLRASTVYAYLTGGTGYAAWDAVTALCPITEIFCVFVGYLTFRYIFLYPTFLFIRSMIFWFAR